MHQQVPPNPPYSLILQGPSLLLVLYYNVQKEVLKINVYFVSSLTVAAFVQKCVSIQIYCFLPQQLTCCISFYISCEIYLLGSDSSRHSVHQLLQAYTIDNSCPSTRLQFLNPNLQIILKLNLFGNSLFILYF